MTPLRTRVLAGALLAGWVGAISAVAGPDFELRIMAAENQSGRWIREPGGQPQGAGSHEGFGPSVSIGQTGDELTVQPEAGSPHRYRLDGQEASEVISSSPCTQRTRITQAVRNGGGISISTWLVKRDSCFHGESSLFQPADPEQSAGASVRTSNGIRPPSGTSRTLESITVISLDGDRLTVETTRALPMGTTQTSTTSYHR